MRKATAQEIETVDAFKRGWTPRRRGAIYCSPRCGANCTRAAFEMATRKCAALCKRLGKGWEPRVWENMGWHYSAQKGVTDVHAHHHKAYGVSYSVYLNSAKQFVTSDRSPTKALALATAEARSTVRKINRDLREIAA